MACGLGLILSKKRKSKVKAKKLARIQTINVKRKRKLRSCYPKTIINYQKPLEKVIKVLLKFIFLIRICSFRFPVNIIHVEYFSVDKYSDMQPSKIALEKPDHTSKHQQTRQDNKEVNQTLLKYPALMLPVSDFI